MAWFNPKRANKNLLRDDIAMCVALAKWAMNVTIGWIYGPSTADRYQLYVIAPYGTQAFLDKH